MNTVNYSLCIRFSKTFFIFLNFLLSFGLTNMQNKYIMEDNIQNCSESCNSEDINIKSKRFVRNKDIQNAAQVTDRTVRRWAKHYNWRVQKLNSKVVRYDAADVEKTLGVEIV